MTRKLTTGIATMSLVLGSATPALAQEQRFAGFDGPRGTTATVNLRIPLGGRAGARAERPSFGLTIGHGQPIASSDPSGRSTVRQIRLADLRLDRDGISRAELATFNLANLEGDARVRRLNPSENKKNTVWLALMAAAGVLAFIWATRGGGDSSSEPNDPPATPPPTGT